MGSFLERFANMSLSDVETMTELLPPQAIAELIVYQKALHIRDVANGEPPYHYSSGNFGSGYVMIKGLVGHQKTFKLLVRQLALKVADSRNFGAIAGLVTGGVPPSLVLRDYLQELQGREIPWVYIRDTRKVGGSQEHITGIIELATGEINSEMPLNLPFVVMEELTNYANSLTNGAGVLRACGYVCDQGLSILDYANPKAAEALIEHQVNLTCLITLPELLDAVEETGAFSKNLVDDYRWSRSNPEDWMAHYNLEKQEHVR